MDGASPAAAPERQPDVDVDVVADETLETPDVVAPRLPAVPGLRRRVRERPRRRGFGAWRSARTRILASYVILLGLSAVLSTVAVRQLLLIRLEDAANDSLQQEMLEFDRLFTDGRDPATGQPFTSLRALFDVYFERNVPSNEEALLAFVNGEQYRANLDRFPIDRIPAQTLAYWEILSGRPSRDDGRVEGRYETDDGTAYFRVQRVREGNEIGAFVVTGLPAGEHAEISELQTYGVAGTLGVLLFASALAWLIAGRALAPVRELTHTAQSISQSDLTRRIEHSGAGDAAEMAKSFNAMLDRLERTFRGQREFIEDMSHELRDPLTIVRGHLELLGDDPEERRETIALVLDELDRMGGVVGDLQLLAEAEQVGFLRPEEIDLETYTHEVVAKAGALAPRRWQVAGVADGVLVADRHRLTEALMNLAHNAVEHTSADGTIAIGTAADEDEVRLWVRDDGTGIVLSDQARIFERFARGRGAHRRYRGSGLGLAIVKAMAEAHGGRVELSSRLGQGSTFTIVLPRKPAAEEVTDGTDPDS
jgi:two-component system, OmpR family, sensor kinase